MNDIPIKNIVIYFWSGTGNSYRVSAWMGEISEKRGLHSRVCSIDKCNPDEEIKNNNIDLIGIVFPTHGFTAPWYMLKYVCRLPRGHMTRVFCVATRAGLRFGRVFVPGISGSATFIIALILMVKGYDVRGVMSVDMPSNWYSLHPIQSRKNQDAIINRANIKTEYFMARMLLNNKMWLTINNICEFTWGVLLSLISVGYLLMGRLFLVKLFFANKNCDGCGICARYCTVEAIKMRGRKNPRPFWRYNCESCMRCSAFCPRDAIEAGHSWGVILYFIAGVPFAAYLFSWFNVNLLGVENLEERWIGDIINLIYFYPAVFVSYYIFNLLTRIPLINWIFTHTTMTHLPFWRRYHEAGTKLKDIAVLNKNFNIQRAKNKL